MKILLDVILAWILIGLIFFIHGIKNAKQIDAKEPFLHGDDEPNKDSTL